MMTTTIEIRIPEASALSAFASIIEIESTRS